MMQDLIFLKQRDLVPADSYAFLLAEGGGLKVAASSGLAPDAAELRFPDHDDSFGWIPTGGKAEIIADTQCAPTVYQNLDPDARSMILAPLMSVERLVGLLFFGARRPNAFSAADLKRAEAFSNNVVFPVQRALLEIELKRLAYTDAQTLLFNHRHFQVQLDEEVTRAQRYGRSVSLIMMDIDSFKEFNDTYGHPAGDQVLKDLAHVVKSNLRTVDIAARYGGEEFVVICPETQRDQAVILAERLCIRIAETPLNVTASGPKRITVSIGVSCFPEDSITKGGLVDAADKALYDAKRAGKNRVVVYSPEH
jgi:diguanylate cyclase (GGDEF)-like protein